MDDPMIGKAAGATDYKATEQGKSIQKYSLTLIDIMKRFAMRILNMQIYRYRYFCEL